MSKWFDVLLEPGRFYTAFQSGQYDPFGATTLLLDGELQHYLQIAQRSPWPSIEDARSPESGYELPAALLLQLVGEPSSGLYERVVLQARRDSAERALAAGLLSALYADSGELVAATEVLERAVGSGHFSGVTLAFLQVHIGLRRIERGSWPEALESYVASREILRAGRSDRAMRAALRSVTVGNEFAVRQIGFGQIDFSLARQAGRYHLSRVDQLTARALETDLEHGFKTRFASSRTMTIQFGSEDAVERSLWGALLRSEVFADFQAINRARQNLGRYILASAAGVEQRSPDSGFALLLRGRDADGLGQAARSYIERGPIASVARVASEVARSEWNPLGVVPSLKLLEPAADVLLPEEVEPLLARLCSAYEQLVRPTALTRAESTVLDTIAAVARVADPLVQAIAARFALNLARASTDALTLQSLRRLVYAVDWATQPADLVDDWIEFIRSSLGAGNDAQMLAEAAFLNLLSARHDELVELARSVATDASGIAMSALRTSSAEDLTDDEAATAARALADALAEIRASAAAGSFGFGRTYDPAAVLALLLLRRPELAFWNDLIDFLSDTRVQRADKAGALEALVDELDSLPTQARASLREHVAEIVASQQVVPFPDPSPEFESTRLRLASALGAMRSSEVLREILVLASTANPAMRAQAARAAAFVEFGDDAAGLSIVLLLSRDSDPDVRALACRALVGRQWATLDANEALVWPRVVELLSEGGREPTLGVVLGLFEGVDAGVDPPRVIRSRVGLLAVEHPSWAVRTMATRLAERWVDQPD